MAGRRAPVDELERPVAERVGQREPERAVGLGVVEALDQLADRSGARVAAAHEARQEGEGQDGEGDEGEQAGDVADPARQPEDVDEEGDAQQRHEREPRPQHRRQRAALGRRRRLALAHEQHERGHQHDDGDERRGVVEDVGQVGRVDDGEDVVRARAREIARDVAAEQEEGQAHDEDVEIPGGDGHALGEGLQPPRREGEDHLDDDHQVQRLDVAADRVDRRVVGLGQPGEKPGDADAGHQQPEAVERAPPPGEDAGAHEAQPDERAEDGGDDLLVLVRRRQRQGDVEAREDHPEGEEGEQGAAQAEHGGPRAARLWLPRRGRPWR